MDLFGGGCDLERFGFLFFKGGFGHGYLHLGFVFTLNSYRIGLGNLDTLIHFSVCFTDRTVSVLLGNAALRIVDSLRRGFFTESGNVARFIADIGYVNVYEAQTDLFKLGLNITADRRQKFISVGIDLLNVHRSNYKTKLTEYDILGKLLYLGELKSEKTLCGVLHNACFGRDTYGKSRGNVYTDILTRERVFKVYLNGDGGKVKISVGLKYGDDKLGAAMDTLRTAVCAVLVFTDRAVNYHDLI